MHPDHACPGAPRHKVRQFFRLLQREADGVFQEIHYLPPLSPWEQHYVFATSYALSGERRISKVVLQRNRRNAFMAPRA